MSNHLKDQTSPYLLQHAENPVDWYPWCTAAFKKAENEDKPVFLSIGYSTCHWCHVMAHESFEDKEIAEILNKYFVCIKVDKEERPDIDSIYMEVCQAFTGSGGWPTSIFMTSGQKPFLAGTYFPKTARCGSPGLKEILLAVWDKWQNDRDELLLSADEIVSALSRQPGISRQTDGTLLKKAVAIYKQSCDRLYGGFGGAPKFPAPHNLLFLMQQAEKHGDSVALEMAETTLNKMYAGGMFDHIGYGFCRYSTDRYFLVPHFEKMLFDNALLILAYCKAYEQTQKPLYKSIAEKTAFYILTEMTSEDGGFYSAQDADSEGEEGKFYTFAPDELIKLLGKNDGEAFNAYFDITKDGNFEGKSIPNLLHTSEYTDRFDVFLPKIREYRKHRTSLNTDDKILTFWNSLMIAAFCQLYKVTCNAEYLAAAKKAQGFIEEMLCKGDTLYVSFRNGRRGGKGFLNDYAAYIYALIALYEVTYEDKYILRSRQLMSKAAAELFDGVNGGFYLYGSENEALILRPKESYDGALPSGNSLMTHDLLRLEHIAPDEKNSELLQKQLAFMSGEAKQYPAGYAMFLTALSDHIDPPETITIAKAEDDLSGIPFIIPSGSLVRVIEARDDIYSTIDGQTAFYICREHTCLPPVSLRDYCESRKTAPRQLG